MAASRQQCQEVVYFQIKICVLSTSFKCEHSPEICVYLMMQTKGAIRLQSFKSCSQAASDKRFTLLRP